MKTPFLPILAFLGLVCSAISQTVEEIPKLSSNALVRLCYGDLEYTHGFEEKLTPFREGIRAEMLQRPSLTGDLLIEAKVAKNARDGIQFARCFYALAEFGKPTKEQHDEIMVRIERAWANWNRNREQLDDSDEFVLSSMTPYLVTHPSPKGEEILLACLKNPDWKYSMPFALRMLDQHPSEKRLEALLARGKPEKPTAISRRIEQSIEVLREKLR